MANTPTPTDDLISATTRLSKAVTSTATVLMTNNGVSANSALLNSTHYQKAIYDTLLGPHRQQDKEAVVRYKRRRAPSEFLRANFSRDEISYRATTHISDQLLEEIPEENGRSFSLYQGFEASIPQVDEELELFKELQLEEKSDKLLTSGVEEGVREALENRLNNPLPWDISKANIRKSTDPGDLGHFKARIGQKLRNMEVKKDLSANEILDLDDQIAKLHKKRAAVFQKVAKLEKDEIFLEDCVEIIDRKLGDLGPGHATDDTSSEDYALIEDESEDDPSFMTQSVYSSLKNKPVGRSRKIKSTLQTFYASGSQISSFKAHEDSITCLDFDYPFGTLVTASRDSTVRIWDVGNQKFMALLEGHTLPVRCVQMADNLVVTGSEDSSLKLWDLSFQNESQDPCLFTFDSHVDQVTALHFDEWKLLSGSADRTIRQWDMTTGHCTQTLDVLFANQEARAHNPHVPFIGALQSFSVALASGTADGVVRLWDLRSGEVTRALTGHTDAVTALQFDDQCLVTGSMDRSIKIWDLRMGRIVENLVYGHGIESLEFDGKRIVFSDGRSQVSVYDRATKETSGLENQESTVKQVKYKEGYIADGLASGNIETWAI